MNWKPEVEVDGKWSQNSLVFATKQEAEDNAVALMWRWALVTNTRAAETTDPVNYRWVDGKLVSVEEKH